MPLRRHGLIKVDGAFVEAHHLWWVREELRLYQQRKLRLAWLQTVIITETAVNETPGIQTGTTSNPTLSRAVALAQDQEAAWLGPKLEWIETIWAKLEPMEQIVLNLMVIKGTHTATGAAQEIQERFGRENVSEKFVYAEQNRGLLAFALDIWGSQIIVRGALQRRRFQKKSSQTAEVVSLGGK